MRLLLLTGEAEGQDSLCQGLSCHMEMALSMSWLGSYIQITISSGFHVFLYHLLDI